MVEAMMDSDWRRGVKRIAGHFFIPAAIPHIASGICYWAGVDFFFLRVFSLPILFVGVVVIFVMEFADLATGQNGWKKGAVDFASKLGGWTAGMMTWLFWW
jgi:hypothetical protein